MRPFYRGQGCVLYHADCRQILPRLTGDLLLTDPPYGIGLRNHDTQGKTGRKNHWIVVGDDSPAIGEEVVAHYHTQKTPMAVFASPKHPWPGKWRSRLVWDKGPAVGGGGDVRTCWRQTWELILIANNGPLRGRRDAAILRFPTSQSRMRHHANEKPVELIEYLIEQLTDPGDTIVDPFAGGGSTAVACVRLGRKFIGAEIESHHCETIARRIRGVTRAELQAAG